ncbi:THUMP domain-containing protein 1 homolog [Thrips palmi]|uniref:THUMP domain-containing protein 1 homolog n=1 Tax=Thrips palmi TaxID=161013 RepID=A0A6P9A2M5_THRPL|nr:THUMP domain-containing protein 1 homolog [Thrips palmi]
MADINKRKKSTYYAKCGGKKPKMQFTLQPGVRGFLATCNFREKDCIREAINILGECADRIYGEDKSSTAETEAKNKKIVFKDSDDDEDSDMEDDIEAALAKEVNVLKQERQSGPSNRRFQVIESGAHNCVFIRSTVEDPVVVVESILKDIECEAKQRTRFLLRLLPIEVTCKAWPDDIKTASGKLFDRYFKGEPKTFCIVFKRRNNNNVPREELIQDLASNIQMRNALHRADMKQPDLSVIVEVIRNICCMAVVPKYFYYRKYNLLEVAKMNAPAAQKNEAPLEANIDDKPDPTCESEAKALGDSSHLIISKQEDFIIPKSEASSLLVGPCQLWTQLLQRVQLCLMETCNLAAFLLIF